MAFGANCFDSFGSADDEESDSSSEPTLMLDCTLSWTHDGVIRGLGVVLRLEISV